MSRRSRRFQSLPPYNHISEKYDEINPPSNKKFKLNTKSHNILQNEMTTAMPYPKSFSNFPMHKSYKSISDYEYTTHIPNNHRNITCTLRHEIISKLRIAPMNNKKWYIEFIDTISNKDKNSITKLTELTFNKGYALLLHKKHTKMQYILLKNNRHKIISFLIYCRSKHLFLYVIKTVITDSKFRGNGLASMLIFALQYKLWKNGMCDTHKLYCEVAIESKIFWNKIDLNFMEIMDKRLFIMNEFEKDELGVCEYMWEPRDGKKAKDKLLEYLNKYHCVLPKGNDERMPLRRSNRLKVKNGHDECNDIKMK